MPIIFIQTLSFVDSSFKKKYIYIQNDIKKKNNKQHCIFIQHLGWHQGGHFIWNQMPYIYESLNMNSWNALKGQTNSSDN